MEAEGGVGRVATARYCAIAGDPAAAAAALFVQTHAMVDMLPDASFEAV